MTSLNLENSRSFLKIEKKYEYSPRLTGASIPADVRGALPKLGLLNNKFEGVLGPWDDTLAGRGVTGVVSVSLNGLIRSQSLNKPSATEGAGLAWDTTNPDESSLKDRLSKERREEAHVLKAVLGLRSKKNMCKRRIYPLGVTQNIKLFNRGKATSRTPS